ncbi:MAG TPA: hypothetical protein VK517_17810, partial [Cyclobacteriaceae bacterium]|nr:hypothetical protein [Cyclobacteriaceae bacterium]
MDNVFSGKMHGIDSVQTRIINKVDSIANLPSRVTHFSDSLKPALSKYNRKLDSIKGKLKHRIDSLQTLNLPTSQYTHLLDSVERAGPLNDVKQAEGRLASLERKANEPVTKLNAEIGKIESKINRKLNLINKEAGSGANLPASVNLPGANSLPTIPSGGINPDVVGVNPPIPNPSLNLPQGALPNSSNPLNGVNGLGNNNLAGNLGKETNELKNLSNAPQKELSQLKNAGELGRAGKELTQVNQISSQAKGYSKDLKNLSKGNLDSVKQFNQALEKKVMQNGEMKQFQSEVKGLDQYKAMAAKGNDAKAMEKLAAEQAKQQAVNHFAGKEKELQSAMSLISKYKQKYSSLASIHDIPKRARNTMHGKPLIERLVPGINLQVQKKSTLLIDLNPQIGYRFNGRLTVGAGWNERVGFHHYTHLSHKDRIFGPRTFAEFKFTKGFALRGEIETMNTFVPPLITASTPD